VDDEAAKRNKELQVAEAKRDARFAEIDAKYSGPVKDLPQSKQDQRHSDRGQASQEFYRDRDKIDAKYPNAALEAYAEGAKKDAESAEAREARDMEDIRSRHKIHWTDPAAQKSRAAESLEKNQNKSETNEKDKGRTK
jgi:hypothetical protein